MENYLPVVRLSETGEYLAFSEKSGVLKIWQVSTGILLQEYVPTSHLSAICTCIAWSPAVTHHVNVEGESSSPAAKKRKLSSGVAVSVQDLRLIAMGTENGSVLLYSMKNSDLYSQMQSDDGKSRVNAVCWDAVGDSLFSCGKDEHIRQWTISSSTVKRKWNSGGEQLSISVCHTRRHLVTGGKGSVKLWDIETQQVLQTYEVHSTEVFSLFQIPNLRNMADVQPTISKGVSSVDGSYVISSAVGDKRIRVRQINASALGARQHEAVCALRLPEPPVFVDVCPPSKDDQVFRLIAVTLTGQLVLFETVLNGCNKKSLEPKNVVRMMSKSATGGGGRGRPLPIVVAGFAREAKRNVILAYEDFVKPVFESLLTSELQPIMERVDPKIRKSLVSEENANQVRCPIMSKDAKVVLAGTMAPSKVTRNRHRCQATEMTIEERLTAADSSASDDGPKRQTRNAPKADNVAVLLEQGIASADKTILNIVLQKTDEALIKATVSRLSSSAVIPLFLELQKRMRGHSQSASTIIVWLQHLISCHQQVLRMEIVPIRECCEQLICDLEENSSRFQPILELEEMLCETTEMLKYVGPINDIRIDTMQPLCEYVEEGSEAED